MQKRDQPVYKSIPAAYCHLECLPVTWYATTASMSVLIQTFADITDIVEALQLN